MLPPYQLPCEQILVLSAWIYLGANHEEKLKKLGVTWDKKGVWSKDPKFPSHPHGVKNNK